MRYIEDALFISLLGNPSHDAPYHNNAHMRQVWNLAKQLWSFEEKDVGLSAYDAYVTLLIASLLHDWGHSAGKETDAVNIQIARASAVEIMKTLPVNISQAVKDAVDSAILCTQFPFVNPPQNQLEKVLRDADLLYAVRSNDPAIVLESLRSEMEISYGRAITYTEMCEGQAAFMKNAELFTTTGLWWWNARSESYLQSMLTYITVQTP